MLLVFPPLVATTVWHVLHWVKFLSCLVKWAHTTCWLERRAASSPVDGGSVIIAWWLDGHINEKILIAVPLVQNLLQLLTNANILALLALLGAKGASCSLACCTRIQWLNFNSYIIRIMLDVLIYTEKAQSYLPKSFVVRLQQLDRMSPDVLLTRARMEGWGISKKCRYLGKMLLLHAGFKAFFIIFF